MIELDGFDFLEKIGTGGTATVWRARQRSLDRDVAIKVLSPNILPTADDVERFIAEARTAGKLKHPGLVQVYDAVFRDGVYCFVMELVDGYTIGQWVRRKGSLAESEALDIADCVAEALDHAWLQHGMVHCDIKPDNVMVDADGTVKITDLGLSRTVKVLKATKEELEEDIFGTPAYIAPEQAMGESGLDFRVDMYSLGATLYHLVSGQMLFEGEEPEKIMELQVSSQVPPLRDLAPHVSAPFESLVEKLLAKDRNYRHSDWNDVRKDIAAIRARRPISEPLSDKHVSTMLPNPNKPPPPPPAIRIQKNIDLSRRNNLRRNRQPQRKPAAWKFVFAGVVAIIVLTLVWMQAKPRPQTGPVISQETLRRAAVLLQEAEDWARANPGSHAEIIEKFQRVVDQTPGTSEAERARALIGLTREGMTKDRIRQQEEQRAAAQRRRDEEARRRVEVAEARRAAEIRRQAETRGAAEGTAALDREEVVRREVAAHELTVKAQGMVDELLKTLFSDGVKDARSLVERWVRESPDVMATTLAMPYQGLIGGAADAEEALLKSFIQSRGKDIDVETKKGRVSGRLVSVDSSSGELAISSLQGTSRTQVTIKMQDLALQERLRRLGSGDSPGLRLARALSAIEQGAYDYALSQVRGFPEPLRQKFFERIPPKRRNQ